MSPNGCPRNVRRTSRDPRCSSILERRTHDSMMGAWQDLQDVRKACVSVSETTANGGMSQSLVQRSHKRDKEGESERATQQARREASPRAEPERKTRGLAKQTGGFSKLGGTCQVAVMVVLKRQQGHVARALRGASAWWYWPSGKKGCRSRKTEREKKMLSCGDQLRHSINRTKIKRKCHNAAV